MLKTVLDLALFLGGWVLAFGVAMQLVAAHPKAFMLATGLAMTVVARRML